MSTLQKLMGKEVYSLLYEHYDENGSIIDDMDDVFYCDDSEIPKDRIAQLEKLLVPAHNAKETLIPLSAAKLLAAWGSEKAIDYIDYCIDNRIDNFGILEPHRIYGYDEIYESFINSLLHYYSRCFDKSASEEAKARDKIFPIIEKIIYLSKELVLDMGALLEEINTENWTEYKTALKEYYIDLVNRPESDTSRTWNLQPLSDLLTKWNI